jgi:glyoxylase I family protein
MTNPTVGYGFDHVALSVADLDALSVWYASALNLVVETRFRVEPLQVAVVILRGDGYRVELICRGGSKAAGDSDPASALLRQGLGHFALAVPHLEVALARLLEHGAKLQIGPSDSPAPGVRYAFVADPEGNHIELIERAGEADRT